MLVNYTGRPLLVKQENATANRYVASGSSDRALLVMPDARCAFHWADSRASERRMTVRFDEYGWQFCSGFDVTHVGSFSLNLRNTHNSKKYIARVNIEQQGPTLVVQFDSELPTMPPYIIENKSHRTIRFWQKNVEKAATVVLPYKGAKYTWDDLSQERILVVECQPKETSSDHLGNSSGIILGAFSVDKIDEYKDLPVDKINVVVFPAGPTKVLRVIDKRIEDHNKNKDERNKSRMRYNGRVLQAKRRRERQRMQYKKRQQNRNRNGSIIDNTNNNNRRTSNANSGNKSRNNSVASDNNGRNRENEIPNTAFSPTRPTFGNRYSPPRKRDSPSRYNNNRRNYNHGSNKRNSILLVNQNIIKTYSYSFAVNLKGFGISLVDNLPRELLYCSIENVFVSVDYDKTYVRLNANIGDLQIDNQLHSTNYPVFLFTGRKNLVSTSRKSRLSLSDNNGSNNNNNSSSRNNLVGNALSCSLISKLNTEIAFVENFNIGITPLDLNIDGDVLVGLWEMLSRINELDNLKTIRTNNTSTDLDENNNDKNLESKNRGDIDMKNNNNNENLTIDPEMPTNSRMLKDLANHENNDDLINSLSHSHHHHRHENNRTKRSKTPNVRTYFQFFKIDQLDLHISFNSGRVGTASSILRSMGATLTHIENAPLRLHGITLRHAYESFDTVAENITAQYSFDALRQAYVILGSSELLGNPITLFKHLGTGVRDFFYEPAVGLIQSPTIFLRGIRRGTYSLFQNTFVGISTFVGTLFGSFLRALIPFTPSLFGLDGLLERVEGAAVALGGSLGALEKEKIRMRRVRPPRAFADSSLKVYDREIEEGDEILSRVSNGMYWGENCVCHFKLKNDLILVITCQRVLIVTQFYEKNWEVMLSDIYRVYTNRSKDLNRDGSYANTDDDDNGDAMDSDNEDYDVSNNVSDNVLSFVVLPTNLKVGFKIEKVNIACEMGTVHLVEKKLQEMLRVV